MKTLTDLYKANTLEFGYSAYDIELVKTHKVSYKTMQSLGRVMSKMSIDSNGNVNPQEMMEIILGNPSEATRNTLIKGLGSHYNAAALTKIIADQLREEGEVPEEDLVIATTTVLVTIENEIVSELFSAYLDNQNTEQSETPR